MITDGGDDVSERPTAKELEAFANAMPAFTFTETVKDNTTEPELTADPEETFDFKLFSNAAFEKVSLHVAEEITYPLPVRPHEYYFHETSSVQKLQLEQSAMDATKILELSKIPCPWNARPKRLKRYTTGGLLIKHDAPEQATPMLKKKGRWRPSKARREKFKEFKRMEEERIARVAGFKTGRGGSSARGSVRTPRKPTEKRENTKKPVVKGYPRKGGPPV